MANILMLGTGSAGTYDLYNTCFIIQNNEGNFLVDTGGSNEIIRRIDYFNIDYNSLNNIFISHSHTDHIFGLFWLLRKMAGLYKRGIITKKLNIYCNDFVYEAIKQILNHVLSKGLLDIINDLVNYNVVKNGDKHIINGIEYTFFDILAKGIKQYGFKTIINNKKIAFLGDEPLNESLYDNFINYDYLFHEVFCLESEENIYHPFELFHSSTRSLSNMLNKLNIKNVIIYHTEEKHGEKRKELYIKETKEYYSGNVYVPDDLEIIKI
ncbi:MAG: MBL fold metallo-hydrolase [Acholeplasmatales bacterium]|nr:MBL fold metallo-hydrolase [Acholeplasmatales bacterium]